MTNPDLLSSEASDLALRALEQSLRPMSVKNLWRTIRHSSQLREKQLPDLLKALVDSGQIRAGRVRSTVYWTPTVENQARERIVEALAEGALTKKALDSRLRARASLKDWPKVRREQMLDQLIKEKRVHKLPPLTGRAKLYSASPDDPRVYLPPAMGYLQEVIEKLSAKLEAKGLSSEQVKAALRELLQQHLPEIASTSILTKPIPDRSPEEIGQLILERMKQIDPAAARGALVSLTELRRSLKAEISDKESFDQAVLRLVEEDRVTLSRHVFTSNLSQEERDMLVSDERSNYYVGIALTT
jgi:hypothetical protein